MTDELLTYQEAAKLLKRKKNTIKDWITKGKISAIYLPQSPNAIGIRRSAVEAIIGNEKTKRAK